MRCTALTLILAATTTLSSLGCERVGEKPDTPGPAAYRADLDAMCRLAGELATHEPASERAQRWAVAADEAIETESVKLIYGSLPELPRDQRYGQILRGAQSLGIDDWSCPALESFWAELAAVPR